MQKPFQAGIEYDYFIASVITLQENRLNAEKELDETFLDHVHPDDSMSG